MIYQRNPFECPECRMMSHHGEGADEHWCPRCKKFTVFEYTPRDLYLPGTTKCHEAWFLVGMLAEIVDGKLLAHPAVTQRHEWHALAAGASEALHKLFRAMGDEHIGTPED